jgi:hypothetical protein
MKKYFSTLVLVFLFMPLVASASWWNPFSWSIFSRKEPTPKVQVETQKNSEEKINELQKQLDELKKEKENSTVKNNTNQTRGVEDLEIVKKTNQGKADIENEPKVAQEVLSISQDLNAETEEVKSDVVFKIVHVGQTIYSKPDVYGAYGLTIEVTAGNEDVFIPQSTTDSTRIFTGFMYSLVGDSFRGSQISEVECVTTTTVNHEPYCKIKSGKSTLITTTVWLTPEQSGNYGVMFDAINYFIGVNFKEGSYNFNKSTQKIYLQG